jgi:hypothetical protein
MSRLLYGQLAGKYLFLQAPTGFGLEAHHGSGGKPWPLWSPRPGQSAAGYGLALVVGAIAVAWSNTVPFRHHPAAGSSGVGLTLPGATMFVDLGQHGGSLGSLRVARSAVVNDSQAVTTFIAMTP